MTGSLASLESLSSPSPSPPPQEDAGVALDAESELSELTDDELFQEFQSPKKKVKVIDGDVETVARRRQPRRGGRKKRGGLVPAPMWDWAYKSKNSISNSNTKSEGSATPGVEGEEEEELTGPPRAMEDEEDEIEKQNGPRDDLDGNSPDGDADADEPLEDVTINGRVQDYDDDDGPAEPQNSTSNSAMDEELEPYASDEEPVAVFPSKRRGLLTLADKSHEREADGDEEDDHPVPDDLDHEHDTESDDNDGPPEADADIDMDNKQPEPSSTMVKPVTTVPLIPIDVTAPPPASVAPIAAAAASHSIMAGSTVIHPPSPTPSASSASGSRSTFSSRSPSPKPENGKPQRKSKRGKKAKDEDGDTATATPLDAESILHEAEVEDELDMDIESDLQPAHRAEALDVLATIELKFALLREKVYVDKMEGLAWEETLVSEGTHPELIHLQAELNKRRDKRLALACRKRMYEVASANKRRKTNENAVWSWWKVARDDLQTNMIAETNRKRRKLERERRTMERPQPLRRIPKPMLDPPPPPTIRQIAQILPLTTSQRHMLATAYPDLNALPPAEAAADLEFLYQHQRMMNARMMPPLYGAPAMDVLAFSNGQDVRMPPPPPPPMFQQPSQGYTMGTPGHPQRLPLGPAPAQFDGLPPAYGPGMPLLPPHPEQQFVNAGLQDARAGMPKSTGGMDWNAGTDGRRREEEVEREHHHRHPHHAHAPPHHHGHHHHRHHHHVVHHHHPLEPQPQPQPELINLKQPHWNTKHGSRPSSTHPPYEERERPVATAFVLTPSHNNSIASSSSGAGLASGPVPSPRHSWMHQDERERPAPFQGPPDRYHSPGPHRYAGPSSNHAPHPQTALSRQNLSGSPPRARPLPPSPPSSLPHPGLRSPLRFESHAPAGSSPVMKSRRLSPPALSASKLGMPPIGPASGFSPRLAGPGAPPREIDSSINGVALFGGGSRTASPLASCSPATQGLLRPVPSKVNAMQIVDGP